MRYSLISDLALLFGEAEVILVAFFALDICGVSALLTLKSLFFCLIIQSGLNIQR